MKNFLLISLLFINFLKHSYASVFTLNQQKIPGNGDLYVCEVGLNSLCGGCNQHYIDINGLKIYGHMEFDKLNAPTSAQVYLNNLYFGSEFYVKYCVDLVGDPTFRTNIIAQIAPSVTIYTGAYAGIGGNDYATNAGLGATVYEDCESNGLQPGNPSQGALVLAPVFSAETTLAQPLSLPEPIELCGAEGCTRKTCVYTIRFNETATCYRNFKCVDEVCKPYESTIKTKFDGKVNFACSNGACFSQ